MSPLSGKAIKFNDNLPSYSAALEAAQAAYGTKAEDITVLDMSGISIMADYFVICSAHTDTHVRAVRGAVMEAMDGNPLPLRHKEGADTSGWILLDWGDVVVHVFQDEQRDYYCLDRLWGDAPARKLSEGPDGTAQLQ